MAKNKQEYNIQQLQTVEYLATNLVQKINEMRPYVEEHLANAFGLEYEGPILTEELSELTEALRD